MFEKLFAENGLTLDRLRTMLEVAATGSISKAAAGDPVRQSQYSRQLRELEDFFRVKLIEREAKGMRLTPNGRELARISRFFLLGLSNFQRGCLGEEQTFRIGASATFIQRFLTPCIAQCIPANSSSYHFEVASNDEVEQRLHDLTLDFGIVTKPALSRPLQVQQVGECPISLYVPRSACRTRARAAKVLQECSLPLALAATELNIPTPAPLWSTRPRLSCDSFLAALAFLEGQQCAAVLPDRLISSHDTKRYWKLPVPALAPIRFQIAWNPRLLRLNPRIAITRDFLVRSLRAQFIPSTRNRFFP